MRSPRRSRLATTLLARFGVPIAVSSADTRPLSPPCRLPLSADRAAATVSYGEAPADATHRAVKAETLSSWSAQRTSAVRIASATAADRGAHATHSARCAAGGD